MAVGCGSVMLEARRQGLRPGVRRVGKLWLWLQRNPPVLGLLVGWLVGMLWWTVLMFAFGPSVVVENAGDGRGIVERPVTVLSRLRWAPVVAVPWATVGLIVGWFTAMARSRWVAVTACGGLIIGGIGAIAGNPFDGWLAIMMPLCCLGGAFGGALVAEAAIALWRLAWTGELE